MVMVSHAELVEKVARVICFETGSMGDPMPIEMQRVDRDWKEHITAAKAAIFAIHAALQEPIWMNDGDYVGHTPRQAWRTMIDASPLKP